MRLHFSDDAATLYHGDAIEVLHTLPDGSIDCCVTSPPYFGLRDYGVAGQIGAESSPAEFVDDLVAVFAEVRRVLANDGTLWLNLGDSYSGGGAGGGGKHATIGQAIPMNSRNSAEHYARTGIGPKNLLGIPWRVAFALQDAGWILRNDIIWAKPNGMPESVTDRLSTKHEHLFLFAKSRRYWFSLDPIRQEQSPVSVARAGRADMRKKDGWADAYHGNPPSGLAKQSRRDTSIGRNPGDVWEIPTQPFSESHFAVFPVEIPRRAIAAGCKPGGVVLDPFSGSGTTGLAASELGRRYVGIDLNSDYLDLSLRTRLAQPSLTTQGEPA